jgi:hypothetical protein
MSISGMEGMKVALPRPPDRSMLNSVLSNTASGFVASHPTPRYSIKVSYAVLNRTSSQWNIVVNEDVSPLINNG